MNWADLTVLAVILVSALISVLRGFVKEVLSLVAWVAAFWAAAVFAAPASGLLEPYVGVPTLRAVFAFVGVMILTLLAAGVVNYAIGRLVAKTGLSGTDRLLGAVFGLVRGVVIVVVLVLIGGLTALPAEPWWQQARTLGTLTTAARAVVAWLPPDLAKHFVF